MNKPFLRQQRESGPDAFAFENFLVTEVMRHHWLGGELSPTTHYDDWISGVDAVAEWTNDAGEPIRLAVDFTSSEQMSTFLKKSDKLSANTQVKYLRSRIEIEQGKPKELRASMPIVLLGFDKEVYRFIAESDEPLHHEHPLRFLLLEQACAQINLQLTLLVHKVFESQRAKRGKSVGRSQEQYALLGNDYTVDQAIAHVNGLNKELLQIIMNEKDQQRFKNLTQLKICLDKERADSQKIPLNDTWTAIAAQSITHQILSG